MGSHSVTCHPAEVTFPPLVVTHQLQVERRAGKVRQSETDVLPLCHAISLCGYNMTLMGKDLLHYSNKTKLNDLRQCRYDY